MVKVLYEKNTIYTEEVDMLFDGKSAEEIIKTIDEKIAKRDEYKKIEQSVITSVAQPQAQSNEDSEKSDINENSNKELPH